MQVYNHFGVATLPTLEATIQRVQLAEELGFDGITVSETSHDPFISLALTAEHTRRLKFGPSVAVAFPRSPMLMATTAWDLQKMSGGRFELGLGTQVKADNEGRFSVAWAPPAPRLREYVQSLRAIWDTFQNNSKLDFRGRHYSFTQMTPMFNPGPIEHPKVPVLLAAMSPTMGRLASEIADGVLLHPLSTVKFFNGVMLPSIQAGAEKAGRTAGQVELAWSGLIATGRDEREVARRAAQVRQQLAFYAGIPTYRSHLEALGWGEVAEEATSLSPDARESGDEGAWAQAAKAIPDRMLDEFAVIAPYDKLARALKERLPSAVTRVNLPMHVKTEEDRHMVKAAIADLQRTKD